MPAVTAPVDPLRSRLLAMCREQDTYPFISLAEDYLAGVPNDHQMRAAAMGELVKKGLFSVAAEIGRACPPTGPEGAELRAAGERLSRGPSEIVDWATTDARFAANLEALRSRGPAGETLADQIEETWRTHAGDFTLHQANDGNVQIRGTRSDGRRTWTPAALDYAGKIEVTDDAGAFKGRLSAPFLFDGVGMGWWLPRLHAATQGSYLNYSCAIYVVERNLRALALVLRVHDWTAALSDERVYLFGGPSAWDQWCDLLKADASLPPPGSLSPTSPWPGQKPGDGKERVAEVADYRDSMQSELCRRAVETYAGRDVAFWADRYAKADTYDPLRVLCITSRYSTFLQYSTRDLMAALERAGMATKLLIEDKDHAMIPPRAYASALVEFQPDLVLTIDHHRYEGLTVFAEDVPFACWIQDPLPNLMCRQTGEKLGPLDFVFGYGRKRCVERFGYPPERFFYAPIPVSTTVFNDGAVEPADASRLQCDVAYVGHMPSTIASLRELWRTEQPKQIHPLLDLIDERIDGILRRGEHFSQHCVISNPAAFVVESDARLYAGLSPEDAEHIGVYYAYRMFDIGFRMQTIEWAADWAEQTRRVFKIYGNGWNEVPRFARHAVGPIEHGEPLRRVYRCAKLALQTIPGGFKHQRAFEALASGCLVLGRYIPTDFGDLSPEEVRRRREAGEELPGSAGMFPGLERVVFRSAAELASIAEQYLSNDALYREVHGKLREVVARNFSYDAVLPGVIENIGRTLRAQADACLKHAG